MKSFPRASLLATLSLIYLFGEADAQQGFSYEPSVLPSAYQTTPISQYETTDPSTGQSWPDRGNAYTPRPMAAMSEPRTFHTNLYSNASPPHTPPAPGVQDYSYTTSVSDTSHSSTIKNHGPAHHKKHALGGLLGGGFDCNCCGPWYGGVSALAMTRETGDFYAFSFDTADEARQLTDARDTVFDIGGGYEVTFGHYFNCGLNAMEFIYWGLYPESDSTETFAADTVGNTNAILNFSQLNYNGGLANLSVDNAAIHQVVRDNEFHSFETNLLHLYGYCGNSTSCFGSNSRHRWLAGFRYFKFRDNLQFRSDPNDTQFTGENDELYYDIDLDNNLFGFQLGCDGDYGVTQCLRLDYGIKVGAYANHVEHRSVIGGAAGVAVINNGPNNGVAFEAGENTMDIAFMSEIRFGTTYQFTRCWSASMGYRALAVSGVALPTDQIYHDLRGIQDVQQVDTNGSLILHGAYLGVEYNF